jgi:glucose-6-phosphate isomerase
MQALLPGLDGLVLKRSEALLGHALQVQQQAQQLLHSQPIISSLGAETQQILQQNLAFLQNCSDKLVVLGIGGASLGGQALCALSADPARVVFLENCDPHSMAQLFARLNPARTSWLLISKSGETVETMAAALALEAWAQTHDLQVAQRALVITSLAESSLRAWAQLQQITILEHPAKLGGRFSVFSLVGMLPAAYAGIDVAQINIAVQAYAASWQNDANLLQLARYLAASIPTQPLHVMMGYADRLRPFTQWYKQLWAESLGKTGRGATPITAIGAIDQHSQLQLFLDGPRDKIFTIIIPQASAMQVPLATPQTSSIDYLRGHNLAAVINATAEATVATMAAQMLPLQVLRGELTPISMAQLMLRIMLQTLLVAAYLQVDPFSQPAVEAGKIRTRQALAASAKQG